MEKHVKIGKLDRKVAIYQKQVTKTSTGATTVVEVLFKECFSQAEDKSGKEEEEGKIYLLAIRDYTIRYDATIAQQGEQMFVKDFDGDYHIASVEHIGRRNYLRLKAIKRE